MMDVKKLAVRLEGLPWKWVRADRLFDDGEELIAFASLSKDAPDFIALAVEENGGFNMINIEIGRLVAGEQDKPVIAGCGQREGDLLAHPLSQVYVPLGFALDVQAWRELADNDEVPNAYWVHECLDLTRDAEDGGDRDRWFSAQFDNGDWWVVDWPTQSPRIGDTILVQWPGESDSIELEISDIRPDVDGIMCAVFGKDGTVGAEAVDELTLVDGKWMIV